MKRKGIMVLLSLLMLVAACSSASAAGERVFDYASLFSRSEVNSLNAAIEQFQTDTGMDFVVLTSNEEIDGASQQQVADAYYDEHDFGLDDENSGMLYYIDMCERYHYISTAGAMIDYMTDARIDSAIERCTGNLSRGNYADAVLQMLDLARGYVRGGIPEEQYRYDVVTGQRLTARHKALTSAEMLVSLAAAAIIGLIFISIVQRRYKLKGSTYDYDYRANSAVRITGCTDDYLRTTTIRTRKADPPSGGGGGFGGGGGGSGVHSSGGTSHGGGGGRF